MYHHVRDNLFRNTYMYKLQLTAIFMVDYYLRWVTTFEMYFSGSSDTIKAQQFIVE